MLIRADPELALIELLDSVRDVGIKLLDAGENIILAFLDLVVTAIRLFQDALNAEIRIPFISDLFKLLGAGKLTILNLLSPAGGDSCDGGVEADFW